MRVGPLSLDTPALLAPMAAVTDLPFRTVCEEFGVGLTVTEFLKAGALDRGDRVAMSKLTPSLAGRHFGVQIYGRVERELQSAAELAVSIGASLVDINMGCPAKRVVAGACGSALMNEPALAARLVEAVVEIVPGGVPVTVKHRAGWDDLHRNAADFARRMVDAGAAMITVHGRTRTQGFAGDCDLSVIADVRAALPTSIPVVGNGDVIDLESYRRMRNETGCDAVMIGRGAMGNPWLFRRIRAVEAGNPDPGRPTLDERERTFLRHVRLIRELRSGPKMIHEIRKAIAWYAKGLRGCDALRKRVWKVFDCDEAVKMTLEYFEGLRAERAAA